MSAIVALVTAAFLLVSLGALGLFIIKAPLEDDVWSDDIDIRKEEVR